MTGFPFDAVLFDVGGVLLTNGWDHVERARVCATYGLDFAAFEKLHGEQYPAWERGATTAAEYIGATARALKPEIDAEKFLAAIKAESVVLADGALPVLRELATALGRKYLIGALNNEARETNEYRFLKFGLRELFEVSLSSCYLGLRKPDAAMYLRAVDLLGRPAERILFIDDRAENVAAAQAVGFTAIHFTGEAALRQALAAAGVPQTVSTL